MIRLILRAAAIAAGLVALLPLHYLWRLFARPSPWPRRFLAWTGRVAGLRVTVLGVPLRSRVLFVANHLSWLDILLVAGTTGAAFVSKAEVARWPVFGWLAGLHRTVFVERGERSAVKGQADALRSALAAGRPMALFPEGTTDAGVEVLPFRASLLASLFPPLPGVTVQPAAIDYGGAGPEIAWVGQEPATSNVRRILSRRGRLAVTIQFLEPIDPGVAGDRKALAAAARTKIVEALSARVAASSPRADRL